jgi:hypothetical protein
MFPGAFNTQNHLIIKCRWDYGTRNVKIRKNESTYVIECYIAEVFVILTYG